jgi:hypothetical protein
VRGGDLPGVAALDEAPGSGREAVGPAGVPDESDDRLGERLGRPRDEQAVIGARLEGLGRDGSRHHRRPRGHRLEDLELLPGPRLHGGHRDGGRAEVDPEVVNEAQDATDGPAGEGERGGRRAPITRTAPGTLGGRGMHALAYQPAAFTFEK